MINIPHYLSASVEYLPADEVGTRRNALMTGNGEAETLSNTLKGMREQGYAILSVKVEAFCKACDGSGKTNDKRRRTVLFATIPCKACKAHTGPLATIPFEEN